MHKSKVLTVRENAIFRIRVEIGDGPIWVSLDEAKDVGGQFVDFHHGELILFWTMDTNEWENFKMWFSNCGLDNNLTLWRTYNSHSGSGIKMYSCVNPMLCHVW